MPLTEKDKQMRELQDRIRKATEGSTVWKPYLRQALNGSNLIEAGMDFYPNIDEVRRLSKKIRSLKSAPTAPATEMKPAPEAAVESEETPNVDIDALRQDLESSYKFSLQPAKEAAGTFSEKARSGQFYPRTAEEFYSPAQGMLWKMEKMISAIRSDKEGKKIRNLAKTIIEDIVSGASDMQASLGSVHDPEKTSVVTIVDRILSDAERIKSQIE